MISYLIRFFVRNLIPPICKDKFHLWEKTLSVGSLKLRNSFGFWQNLWDRSLLIALVLLCSLIFLLLSVKELTFLVSGFIQLLLEVSFSDVFWDYHNADTNFGGDSNDKFLMCSTRGTRLRARGLVTSSKPLLIGFRKTTLLSLWYPVRMTMVPGVMLACGFLMLTERFSVVA